MRQISLNIEDREGASGQLQVGYKYQKLEIKELSVIKLTCFAIATENYVINPVCMVLHGGNVWILLQLKRRH